YRVRRSPRWFGWERGSSISCLWASEKNDAPAVAAFDDGGDRGTDHRDIPAELRRVPPELDGGLGGLRFCGLLAEDDWHWLPPAVRRRFSKRLAGGRTMIYVGEVLETRMSRIGWLLAQVARLFGGPLPTSRDANTPSVVTVTEDMATGGQIWT